MPLRARVTLEMVHFDGRAVGGAPEGCARCLMCRCEHSLNAKSSQDDFVAQRREWHFCGVSMGGSLRARVSLKMVHLDGRAVIGAPGSKSAARAEIGSVPYSKYRNLSDLGILTCHAEGPCRVEPSRSRALPVTDAG